MFRDQAEDPRHRTGPLFRHTANEAIRAPRDHAAPNEAIYERGEVKRAGAGNCPGSSPHIPLAVGVGRSGPSQTPPRSRFVHSRHTSPEPEAEGEPPASTFHFEPMPA